MCGPDRDEEEQRNVSAFATMTLERRQTIVRTTTDDATGATRTEKQERVETSTVLVAWVGVGATTPTQRRSNIRPRQPSATAVAE